MILKSGGVFNHLKILSPKEVVEKAKNEENLCIINAVHVLEVKEQLISLGVNESQIDMNGYFIASGKKIMQNIDKCEKVYFMLEDEFSKEIFLANLNYKLSGNRDYLKNLMDDNAQYFDRNIIKFIDNEVFVDCGSFNGDTLDVFYMLTKGRYKEYIALEADPLTYKQLNKKVESKNYLNVTTLNYACWNESAELKFNAQQLGTSCIIENGSIVVKADSLDHILKNKSITFIKMDIEGAEENALKGSKRIIKAYKPILAICIYHNPEDYYTLPLLIKELNEDYHLYIRHYSKVDTETVCYAIPKERCL